MLQLNFKVGPDDPPVNTPRPRRPDWHLIVGVIHLIITAIGVLAMLGWI